MVRVGIIGVSPLRGWATTAHIPALRALPNYEIAALSAHSAESARAAGEVFGVSAVFSDHEELVTHPDIDLVAVTVKVDVWVGPQLLVVREHCADPEHFAGCTRGF